MVLMRHTIVGRHYPIADHYLRRNPFVAPLQTQQHLVGNTHVVNSFPPTRMLSAFSYLVH